MTKFEKIAYEILEFLKKNELDTDTRIYFDGKAIGINSSKQVEIMEGIKGSEYSEYANDETITMTFEGGLYGVVNLHYGDNSVKILKKFNKLLAKHGYYYELGNAWNLSLYEL